MTVVGTYGIALLATFALIGQLLILRKSGALARDPLAAAGLSMVFLAGLLYEAEILPESRATQLGIILLTLLLAFLLVVRSLRNKFSNKIFFSAFLPATVSASLFAVNAVMNPDLELSQTLGRSFGIISLVALGLIFSLCSLTLRDLAGVVIVSICAVFSVAPLTGDNWRSCDIFKCGPFGGMYTGPFYSENTVAMLCGLGILCALISFHSTKNFAAFGFFALALYATESRTSQLAIAVALAAWPLAALCARFMHKNVKRLNSPPAHRRIVVAAFSAGTAALFLVGFRLVVDAQPSDFSNRGGVWILGLAGLGKDWFTGVGLDRWYIYQSVGAVPAHFPHSEYLFLLFAGGTAAIAGLYCIFVQSLNIASQHRGTFAFSATYVVYLGVMGMTELYWNPIALDGNALMILPLFFILARKVAENLPDKRAAAHSPKPKALPDYPRPHLLHRPGPLRG